jgi:hypothetical protein
LRHAEKLWFGGVASEAERRSNQRQALVFYDKGCKTVAPVARSCARIANILYEKESHLDWGQLGLGGPARTQAAVGYWVRACSLDPKDRESCSRVETARTSGPNFTQRDWTPPAPARAAAPR